MSNPADVIRPPGATHVAWFYGDPIYYKAAPYGHLNQVTEERQTKVNWTQWDPRLNRWEPVGGGFSSRTLKELK